MATIEIYEDKAGEWRWRKKSGSDIVADSGEGYSTSQGAWQAADRESTPDDTIVQVPPENEAETPEPPPPAA